MREFLNTVDGPLSHLSSTYATEIKRAGGLSDLDTGRETKETRIWASLGLRPPMLFPAAECWKRKPSSEEYFTDLLHGFSKHTTQIYSRGNPSAPLYPPPFHVVLQQLEQPNSLSTTYAINMTAEAVDVKIPERLQGQVPIYQDGAIVTTTNITPKFSTAGLHVDHGKHGVTLLHGGCVKLWALYPLTPHNLEQFSAVHRSDAAFIEVRGQLEGGELCVQTDDQAIYLPPGCIHSAYTLRGGLVPGIEFTTVECLEPAAEIWDLNSKGLKLCGNDCYPFLEAIIMGLRSKESDQPEKALELLCPRYKKISRLNPTILSKVKQALPKSCPKCRKPWAKH
ncbi:hypothetical protein F4825DRAFT_201537 [Nemania diffusa]|nr:hypothetical protein F4825DRAFT_201537 [Nemania diffusa]